MTSEAKIPAISPGEVQWSAIRSRGAGGQNVNKVATAVHLRFDIRASSLPAAVKQRLLESSDQRITRDGVVIIKARRYRSQDKNRDEALRRLRELIAAAAVVPRARRPTRPPERSRRKRREDKARRASVKAQRGKVLE